MTDAEPAAATTPLRPASPLRDALREARTEAAERTGLVVDLRDAELARLELLSEALDPLFADLPPGLDLFDRAVMPGASPRLWIDMVAHVSMGRDKRLYRFLQDTRHGRRVLIESAQIEPVVAEITRYVARRIVERDRALATTSEEQPAAVRRRGRSVLWFALGALCGAAALFTIAWFVEPII